MKITTTQNESATKYILRESVNIYDDTDARVSTIIGANTMDTCFCGKQVKTLAIGGVETDPQYRRYGYVRQMLEHLLEMAPEKGWMFSLLHPFSFSYYRKFGYEKLADHLVLKFPIVKLEHLPRYSDLIPVKTKEEAGDCIQVYEEFSKTRNLLYPRKKEDGDSQGSEDFYLKNPQNGTTYLWHDEKGKPAGYVILSVEKYVENHFFVNSTLHVHELVFTTPKALEALFGFVRMFEGETEIVKIHNCAMSPEIDQVLRHYHHITYERVADLAGRILDVEGMLKLHSYPEKHGGFTIKIHDNLPFTRGIYQVEYQGGNAQVTRQKDGTSCDLEMSVTSFAQLLYGYEEYTKDLIPYMEGAVLHNENSDLFSVFHKMKNGMFELF